MKTSEDKLNEALRSALKRKFDDFGDQPNPSSYDLIRARLKQPRNYKYLLLTIALIAFFVAGVMIDQHWITTKSDVLSTKTGIKSVMQKAANLDINQAATTKNQLEENDSVKQSVSEPRTIVSSTSTKISMSSVVPALSPATLPTEQTNIVDAPEILEQAEIAALPVQISSISALQPESFKTTGLNLPAITITEALKSEPAIHTNSQKISWLLNLASLKTYQILTVPKSGDRNFQNFKFPSTFALESLGYKVSIGAEKNGFQMMLHYSTFRQRYSYEIAGDEYVVQAVGQADYKIVRPGTIMNEDNKFELLGIGLSKEVQWGGSPPRRSPQRRSPVRRSPLRQYYASAGVQYSHTLNAGPDIGWINAGFGRQFAINRTVLLNVGPYAEFSPLRLSGKGDPFFYQPYRVGISLGMKLVRP
ncbi:hypothetical protein [Dyadobacter arcticus]|uniref:Outer membrane protein beta-barrel domain-containing protein n=1 Tax=Dyadobacter arcticus TaxID=1078754 RepID=A0ABX0ULA1_9BACT|nr:hypothetical protein [Dyadobacter arcticus]NIJ53793.1 hypothetical protein [Dyadobacter arcticus]